MARTVYTDIVRTSCRRAIYLRLSVRILMNSLSNFYVVFLIMRTLLTRPKLNTGNTFKRVTHNVDKWEVRAIPKKVLSRMFFVFCLQHLKVKFLFSLVFTNRITSHFYTVSNNFFTNIVKFLLTLLTLISIKHIFWNLPLQWNDCTPESYISETPIPHQ